MMPTITKRSSLANQSTLESLRFNKNNVFFSMVNVPITHQSWTPPQGVGRNSTITCFCINSLKMKTQHHQAMPFFFFFPCPTFFVVRLPFSFLACRWFIQAGYWPLSSNMVFLLRLLSVSIFPPVKHRSSV